MNGKQFQLHVALATSFGQTCMGLLNVWPSYTSGIYASNATTPLSAPMSQAEDSLLGSLPSLGAMVGTAITGILIDKLGRRNGGVILVLPYAISWAMISVTTSTKVVLAARFLSGLAGGSTLVFGPIFISEVAEDSFRGALASGPILLYTSGTLISYLFGWFLSYRTIIWCNLVFGVSCALFIASLKESPVYLLRQKRDEDAKASIAHYRGVSTSSEIVLDEYLRLKKLIYLAGEATEDAEKMEESEREKLNTEDVVPVEQKKMSPFKMLFVTQPSRRAFLIVIAIITLHIWMGIVPVQVYAKTVFVETDPERADLYSVIFALVYVCGSMASAAITDMAGRRVLIISSSIAVCIFMSALGYLLQSKVAPPWVIMVLILLYCFSDIFGAGMVPYVLLAEVFAPEVQNLASIIVIEWVWFLNFAIIAVFPIMNSLLGIYGSFYVFAFMGIANAIVSFFVMPETKGVSHEEIQAVLLGKKAN